ncbi:MAG: phosphoenolpyruvate--protein phosphotransferase [Stellaceae bacterium]
MIPQARASVVIRDAVGLHARPSVKLTKLAKGFAAQIDLGLSPEGPWIDAKSIVKVMATKAPKDSTIYFRAEGADAEAAVRALASLVEDGFEEGAKLANGMLELQGRPAAPGLAAGVLVRLSEGVGADRAVGTPDEERRALMDALALARAALSGLSAGVADPQAEAILAFQLALLEDDALTAPALAKVEAGRPAHDAWTLALDAEIASYEAASDAYFRGRAADLRDLRDRVLRQLTGEAEEALPVGAVVAAEDLPPSRFLSTDWRGGGLVLERGSPSSHVAILARSRGVPMVVGVSIAALQTGQAALLDGDSGVLILDPDAATRLAFDERRVAETKRRREETALAGVPAVTGDGERVQIMINVADPAELDGLDPAESDGIGLVRTELLFHGRERLPDEEEQFAIYRRLLDWAGGRPVTIRTLDAGGDKPIPGLTRTGETNPFLGVRGVRLSLRRPDIFRVQLRALARAATAGNLKVMIPMVTTAEEMRRCHALLSEAVADLRSEGLKAELPPLGMMVEVPAAALEIEEFDVDFYSIGSNDLLQYVAAASRDDPELAELARPSRALLRLVKIVVDRARSTGREVSLCGDLGSDPKHIAALLDQGLRTLSVARPALASVKAAIARYRRPQS